MNKKFLIPFVILFLIHLETINAQEKIIKIWPSKAPGTENRVDSEKIVNERYYKVYQPDLRIFQASNPDPNKPAVLICAGGGYDHIAIVKEGYKTAEWLNSLGVSAFVLKYRLNRTEALTDAERALSLIRSKAKEFNINPNNIGIVGFSAGGHLALNLAVHCKDHVKKFNDKIDSVSCKPDFMILNYPQADSLAEKRFLTNNIPPTFIMHAADDKTVPVQTSIELFNNLHSLNVPVEIHIFEKGGHGFGLGEKNDPDSKWPMLCKNWMIIGNILSK
jgi:acetyl esterase/lipase